MAAVTGPDFITLHVRDVEVSRKFYEEVVGLTPSPEKRPNAAAFATKPAGFAVRRAEIDLDAVSLLSYGVLVWFKADDSAALLERLRKHGVKILKDISEGPFGKTFVFQDPDGYPISVHDGG